MRPYNEARPDSPAGALQALRDGNSRWSSGLPHRPGQDLRRRSEVAASGQNPFAAILSCSDSRVSPEFLFDQGLGDLFVVRNAGNSADTISVESLQYAVDRLGAHLVMVLGHQKCGAVTAAVDSYPKPAPLFVSAIYDAVARSKAHKRRSDDSAAVDDAIDEHVMLEVRTLRRTLLFDEKIAAGQLLIVGARYDLDSGNVTILIE
jgi:carbonic anhydrase